MSVGVGNPTGEVWEVAGEAAAEECVRVLLCVTAAEVRTAAEKRAEEGAAAALEEEAAPA